MAQLVEHSPSKGKVLGSNPGEGFARLPEWSKGVVSSSTIERCAGSNPAPCTRKFKFGFEFSNAIVCLLFCHYSSVSRAFAS